jgi:hypothetical protein
MRLRRAISAAWSELGRSSEPFEPYLDLDPTPTPDEEKRGFKDPRFMIGHLEQLNISNLQADIARKKWFTRFSYFIASLWTVFLISITYLQGLKTGYKISLYGADFNFPAFYLDQWAFVAMFGSSTASIYGFVRIIGMSLFDAGGAMQQNLSRMSQPKFAQGDAASSPSTGGKSGAGEPHP